MGAAPSTPVPDPPVISRENAYKINASPGISVAPLKPSNVLPAYPGSESPTGDVLMNADRTICINHNIEFKINAQIRVVASGTAEILNKLNGYRLIFLVDVGSEPGGRGMAEEAVNNLMGLAKPYLDCDVEIAFTGDWQTGAARYIHSSLADSERLCAMFQAHNSRSERRNLPAAIKRITQTYLEDLAKSCESSEPSGTWSWREPKPVCLVVITDCRSADEVRAIESTIVHASRYLDQEEYPPGQLGIELVPIAMIYPGTPQQSALNWLDSTLAEDRQTRDIVDWTPYRSEALNAATLIKILLGSIDPRIDKGLVTQLPPEEEVKRKGEKRKQIQ